jgi:hypothetical protein
MAHLKDFTGKLSIKIVIAHGYVKLPEGKYLETVLQGVFQAGWKWGSK